MATIAKLVKPVPTFKAAVATMLVSSFFSALIVDLFHPIS
jgi:hypothetical protein